MGGGTLLVSIPKSWARKNGITKGATLAVEELSERKLIVRPIEDLETLTKETTVEYPREDLSYVVNDVTGAYLLGYDQIHIQGRRAMTREDRERLKATIGRLIGLEIMDEDSKKMTLQFLLEPAGLNPEKIARRMASIIGGMMKDTREGISELDPKLLSTVEERDDEVDRLYFLLVRIIRTATIHPEVAERYKLASVEILDYRVLASFLESVGDTVAELSKRLARDMPSGKLAAGFVDCFGKLEEMEEIAMRSFLVRGGDRSKGASLELEVLAREVSQASTRMAREKSPRTSVVEVVGLIERASKVFVDIADLSLPNYPIT